VEGCSIKRASGDTMEDRNRLAGPMSSLRQIKMEWALDTSLSQSFRYYDCFELHEYRYFSKICS
jgi:hypothetical protein